MKHIRSYVFTHTHTFAYVQVYAWVGQNRHSRARGRAFCSVSPRHWSQPGKMLEKRAAGRSLRHRVLTWGVCEAALALAARLSQQVRAGRNTHTSPGQLQNLTSPLVEVGQALPLPADELREMQHTSCMYERTSDPPRQQPQLPRPVTGLSRRVEASSCWSGAQIRVPGRHQNAQVPGLLGRNLGVDDGKGRLARIPLCARPAQFWA